MNYQTQSRKRFALLALMLGALALSGCGVRKTARDSGMFDSASRTVLDAGAACNSFSSSNIKLDGKIQTYIGRDGREHDDVMHLRITGLTSAFDTTGTYKIRLFRARAYDDVTVPYVDSEPLEFTLERSKIPISGSGIKSELTKGEIARLAAANGLSGSSTSDFLNNVDFVVTGADYDWDVLIISIRDESNAAAPVIIGEAKVLMPTFTANPNLYATDHPAILSQMHPFWSMRASTNVDFAAMADSLCF